jgi:hypothetical protein
MEKITIKDGEKMGENIIKCRKEETVILTR